MSFLMPFHQDKLFHSSSENPGGNCEPPKQERWAEKNVLPKEEKKKIELKSEKEKF